MKNALILFCFIFLLGGCGQPNTEKKSVDNINLVRDYFELFNAHKWENVSKMYAQSALFKDPSLGKGTFNQSQREIFEKYKTLNDIFKDIHDEVMHIYPSGDEDIIVEFVSTGTAPDGTKFNLPIVTIFKIKEDKIIQDFTYYDNFDEGE